MFIKFYILRNIGLSSFSAIRSAKYDVANDFTADIERATANFRLRVIVAIALEGNTMHTSDDPSEAAAVHTTKESFPNLNEVWTSP